MKSIEVITTQHVRISYELGSLGDRATAFFLDLLVMFVFSLIMNLLILLITESLGLSMQEWYELLFVAPLLFFYTPIMEIFMNGQTPGKKALKIQVLSLNGKSPELIDIFIRWAFRILDIWTTLGALATVLIISGDRSQRLGDRLSNTAVVRLQPKRHIGLEQLLKIDKRSNHVVRFPQVRQLNEEEMLTLKHTLDRYEEHNNEAHREALFQACERIKEETGIDAGEMMPTRFIEALIQDYVVLTR